MTYLKHLAELFLKNTTIETTQLLVVPPLPSPSTNMFETKSIDMKIILLLITFIILTTLLINESLILYKKNFKLFPSPFNWATNNYANYQWERSMNIPYYNVKEKVSPHMTYSKDNTYNLPNFVKLDVTENGLGLVNRKNKSTTKTSLYNYESLNIIPETSITIFALIEESNNTEKALPPNPDTPPTTSEAILNCV